MTRVLLGDFEALARLGFHDVFRRSDLERLFLGVSYRARAHFVASTPAASW